MINGPEDLAGTICEPIATIFASWKREGTTIGQPIVVTVKPIDMTCEVNIIGDNAFLRGVFLGETMPLERVNEDDVLEIVDIDGMGRMLQYIDFGDKASDPVRFVRVE